MNVTKNICTCDDCYYKQFFKRSNKVLEQSIQKKGVWIMGTGMGTYCSKCYYRLQTTGLLSICPNCGARMEGQI